jgi:C_GCAxxG_C_C family probable redox protein
MNKREETCALFQQGANCAQSVFCAFSEELGLDRQVAMRICTGLGGGMGALGSTCGAVSGAFMALGLRFGLSTPEQMKLSKFAEYRPARAFAKSFVGMNGSLICKELLGCDISTPEGMKEIQAKNLFAVRCTKLISDATQIVEEMMGENPSLPLG